MKKERRVKVLASILAVICTVVCLSTADAATDNISHSYHTNSSIASGSLVSLDPNRADYVQLADTTNASRLLGIVVAASDSLIALDPSQSTVQVATDGIATTLVSDVNGDINVGDEVAVSPFSGFGMKSAPGLYPVGLAQTSFSSKTPGAVQQSITDKSGNKTKVNVGYIRLNIGIGTGNANVSQSQLNALQRLAQSITGRTVSTARVIISIAVAVIALLALITLIYTAIYGSIISVGRNPLAKYAIFRALALVFGMAGLVTGLAAITIYFILK